MPTSYDRYIASLKNIASLRKENADLHAIVDQYPKTADGVPVIFYMDVFIDGAAHITHGTKGKVTGVRVDADPRVRFETREVQVRLPNGFEAWIFKQDCYSTESALTAAKAAKGE